MRPAHLKGAQNSRLAVDCLLLLALVLVFLSTIAVAQGNATASSKQTVAAEDQALSRTTESWHTELVDTIPQHEVGQFSSMAIDQQGNFHIAYIDQTQKVLRYAYRGRLDKKWFSLEVGPGEGACSLAVDAAGRPHIAYISQFNGGLRYATWDGKKWHFQLIDGERIEFFTSIQLDSQGHPKISYYHRLYPDGSYALRLKYAYFDGSTWFIQTVDQRFGTGKFNSLALDASGNPHIAYSDTDTLGLRYAHWDGSHWLFASPDSAQLNGGTVGWADSIAVDSAGNPHIAYLDPSHRRLKYAHKHGDTWERESVEHIVGKADAVDRVSLKLDTHGHPHIAYYEGGRGELHYASRTDKGWQVEVVDNSGNVGMYPSLCFTSDDEPFISYYDVTNNALRVAHRGVRSISVDSARR